MGYTIRPETRFLGRNFQFEVPISAQGRTQDSVQEGGGAKTYFKQKSRTFFFKSHGPPRSDDWKKGTSDHQKPQQIQCQPFSFNFIESLIFENVSDLSFNFCEKIADFNTCPRFFFIFVRNWLVLNTRKKSRT